MHRKVTNENEPIRGEIAKEVSKSKRECPYTSRVNAVRSQKQTIEATNFHKSIDR